jgi:hypothetical protein
MSHFIENCDDCGGVISQCRCPSINKEKRIGVCPKCSEIRLKKRNSEQQTDIKRSFTALNYINEHSPDNGPWGLSVENVVVLKRILST